ncbi:MAG: cytochrome C oxidase subunit IV family protein [Chitinophagales bacterium]|nr:cytochrome C oxidase subunit IV family protein [Bacteroidota bacterium]MCB9044355.1 cytochrome C oxidase subunit IV family protein [Chitinophagales bacterium]
MGQHILDDTEYRSQVRAVWRATLWLTIITIIEVGAAVLWYELYPTGNRFLLNSFFIGASLLKAYFIVAEFMHVKYETRALTISILAPTMFFIWFIIAFLMEGESWGAMRTWLGI